MPNIESKAGDHIDARCTRCRAVTNHTIIAMVAKRPARVRCNTCAGDHNYRSPSPAKTAPAKVPSAKPGRRTTADRQREAQQQEWRDAAEKADSAVTVAYRMDRSYRVGDLVDHTIFGVGVVQQVIKPNKMEILFAVGVKSLRCRL